MIELGMHAKGIILSVRAQPRARKARIIGEHAGAMKVAVTDPPERGKANQAIMQLLCEHFELKKSQVILISGESSRQKRFLLVGVKPDEVRGRLDRLIAGNEP